MPIQRRAFLQWSGLALATTLLPYASSATASARIAPALMLANSYRPGLALADYWVSEKFDGVRAYWDGETLWTRGGLRVPAPAWFTAKWPKQTLDGELWSGRGQFSKTVSIMRQQAADDAAWHAMRFMVFDVPSHGSPFTERIPALNGLASQIDQPWVQAVAQSKVANHAALQAMLHKTVKNGGEGLMLHRGASLYVGQRSNDLLKFKLHEDDEALVLAHVPGKGKYAGKLGALLVEMPATDAQPARRFKLGTGLTDAQRENPPAVGSTVVFRFRGLNDSGIPRFASFMRLRED